MIQFRSKKYQEKYRQNMIPELSLVSKQEEKQDNLRLLSQSDNEELYFKAWEHLDENVKKRLSTELWQDRLTLLTHDYTRKNITEQVKVLETLAYIHTKEAVDFLVEALKSRDEILRLNAAAALKKQDPLLILEPMIDALTKPEVFLAARVYDVLSETGALLVPLLLQKLPASDTNAKTVMIQLLGVFGDESVCCSIYAAAEGENTSVRKAAAESYAALGGRKKRRIFKPRFDRSRLADQACRRAGTEKAKIPQSRTPHQKSSRSRKRHRRAKPHALLTKRVG